MNFLKSTSVSSLKYKIILVCHNIIPYFHIPSKTCKMRIQQLTMCIILCSFYMTKQEKMDVFSTTITVSDWHITPPKTKFSYNSAKKTAAHGLKTYAKISKLHLYVRRVESPPSL